MKTILLYGYLGKKFGKVHRYAVDSPAEAIRALSATIEGFKQNLIGGEYYRVVLGGKTGLDVDTIHNPTSNSETIRIVPVVVGASGIEKIILGAALIVATVYTGGAVGGFWASTAGTFITSAASSIGYALVLGGISELLFSPPSAPDSAEASENRPSFLFNGAVNTSTQGNAAPLLYGRLIVGSQVISTGLSVEQI